MGRVALLLAALWIAPQALLADDPLYVGAFSDGAPFSGAKVSDWHDPGAQPKVNGVPIFDPNRPVRWLRNVSAEEGVTPPAYVEFVGGDRLPGVVVGYAAAGRDAVEQYPAHLIVRPAGLVDAPLAPAPTTVRVRVDLVRRIVWQSRGEPVAAARMYYSDGRAVDFRSLRWSPNGVVLLVEEGITNVAFGDIAELSLPQRSWWDGYLDTVAALAPDGKSRLVRFETNTGIIGTVSASRIAPRNASGDPAAWFHLVQPAWAIDAFWIRHITVVTRRFFWPHELPASSLEIVRQAYRPALGNWHSQVDRNVRGEPLASSGGGFGWGFGVGASSELALPVPPLAKTFRTRVGLDASVGVGGCVRTRVYFDQPSGQPAYESKPLIGGTEIADTGALPIPAAAGSHQVILVADMAHTDRPAGADPLDIRDLVDWFEPQFDLDAEKLAAELRQRATRAIPAWAQWKPTVGPAGTLVYQTTLDRTYDNAWRLRTLVAPTKEGELSLLRQVTLSPKDRYLSIRVCRYAGTDPNIQIEARISGAVVARFPAPEFHNWEPLPTFLVSLAGYEGKTVDLEVVQLGAKENVFLDWHALDLAEYTTVTPWVTLEPTEIAASGGSKIAKELGAVVFVPTEPAAQAETYTIGAETDLHGITAIRLETLTDDRLPNRGSGRAPGGEFILTDLAMTARSRTGGQAEKVDFADVKADYAHPSYLAPAAIDVTPQGAPPTGWSNRDRVGQPHVAIFTTKTDVDAAAGLALRFELEQRGGDRNSLGKFRLSATNVRRPIPLELPGTLTKPPMIYIALPLVDDAMNSPAMFTEGAGVATIDRYMRQFGSSSLKVTPPGRDNANIPGWAFKIREKPAEGEYRFMRWFWKKDGGQQICLQLAHDGKFGPTERGKFRYHAGQGGEPFGASTAVAGDIPREWQEVSRDLFAEYGEFTLTGLGLDPMDGQCAWFDQILLGKSFEDMQIIERAPKP